VREPDHRFPALRAGAQTTGCGPHGLPPQQFSVRNATSEFIAAKSAL
jgi:hypothetical protein